MFGLSVLAMSRGEYAAVERLAHETRTLFHGLGNAGQEAFCLFHLGQATTRLGKYDDARAYLEAGLALSRTARLREAIRSASQRIASKCFSRPDIPRDMCVFITASRGV